MFTCTIAVFILLTLLMSTTVQSSDDAMECLQAQYDRLNQLASILWTAQSNPRIASFHEFPLDVHELPVINLMIPLHEVQERGAFLIGIETCLDGFGWNDVDEITAFHRHDRFTSVMNY